MNNFEYYHGLIHKNFLLEVIAYHEAAHIIYINTHQNIELLNFSIQVNKKDGRIVGGNVECKTPLFVPLEVGGSGFAGILGEHIMCCNRFKEDYIKTQLREIEEVFFKNTKLLYRKDLISIKASSLDPKSLLKYAYYILNPKKDKVKETAEKLLELLVECKKYEEKNKNTEKSLPIL